MRGDLNTVASQSVKMGINVFGGCKKLTGDINVLMANLDSETTVITENQFSGFAGVTGSLVIPSRITEIEPYAFYGCSSIEEIIFEDESLLNTIGNYAFSKCSSANNKLIIPDNVTSIGEYTFNECTKLTGLELDNNLTSIGQHAFYNCKSMIGKLIIPSGVDIINQWTFTACAFNSIEFLSRVDLNRVVNLKDGCFQLCRNIEEITFPECKVNIGYVSFENCTSLSSIINFEYVKTIGIGGFRR